MRRLANEFLCRNPIEPPYYSQRAGFASLWALFNYILVCSYTRHNGTAVCIFSAKKTRKCIATTLKNNCYLKMPLMLAIYTATSRWLLRLQSFDRCVGSHVHVSACDIGRMITDSRAAGPAARRVSQLGLVSVRRHSARAPLQLVTRGQ